MAHEENRRVLHRFDAKEQAQERAQELEKRLNDLLEGKEPPPNKFVSYMLDKIRAARKEFDELRGAMQKARAALMSMERRQLVLQGEHNKYIEDIMVWDKKAVDVEDESRESVG